MRQPAVIPKEYQATVQDKKTLSPKVIWLRLLTQRPVPYIEGQYASFLIGDARRPLSFASLQGEPAIELVVDISPGGVASTFIQNIQPGDTARFLAPYGRFTVDASAGQPLLFIATGAGIAPIRAQIHKVLRDTSSEPVPSTLVFGNHDEEHLLFFDEFTQLAQQNPTFSFIPVCSTPSSAWTGERGLVTEVTPRRVSNLVARNCYVCGGPEMVKDTVAMLKNQGVPNEQIHTEQFI